MPRIGPRGRNRAWNRLRDGHWASSWVTVWAMGPDVSLASRFSPASRRRTAWSLAYALASTTTLALTLTAVCESSASAAGHRAASVEALARRLGTWVGALDAPGRQSAIKRVTEGVPPGAMVAFLVAVAEHPHADYEALVRQATRYRRVGVRAHALVAWAAMGPQQAGRAVQQAADDPEQGIRRLAVVLADQHTSPASDEVVRRLLQRDVELAAERGGSTELVPVQPGPEPESEPDVIVIDDDDTDDQQGGA